MTDQGRGQNRGQYENRRQNQNGGQNGRKNRDNKIKIPKPDVPAFLAKDNYVATAENVVLHLYGNGADKRFIERNSEFILKESFSIKSQKFNLTTTKIRNLLSLLNVIYQDVQMNGDKSILSDNIVGKIQYFKMRCAYEAGREPAVADFVEKSNMMKYIDHIKKSKEEFLTFFNYVEALVAYHRYYGGSEN